jgi:hypothetical protein
MFFSSGFDMSECEGIRRKLRELEHYLTHIKWDLEETEFAMKIDRLHGIERPSVKMHYEWLKRKREEVEREIEELKKKLATCK